MIVGRDSKGRFMRKQVVRKVIGEGVVKLEPVQVICPACGEQVEAVARDSQVKGYCAVARHYVDFPIETQRVPTDKNRTTESRTKKSAASQKYWEDPDYRAKHSATTKKLWEDPEYRARQIAARTGKHLTPEHRAKISATLTRRHSAAGGTNERPG